jgi:hypothetical protein
LPCGDWTTGLRIWEPWTWPCLWSLCTASICRRKSSISRQGWPQPWRGQVSSGPPGEHLGSGDASCRGLCCSLGSGRLRAATGACNFGLQNATERYIKLWSRSDRSDAQIVL